MGKQYSHWSVKPEKPYLLNLSDKFNPFSKINGLVLEFEKFQFHGGEPHFKINGNPQVEGSLLISQRFNSIADFFDILLANDAARRMGFKEIHLMIPYFPAARQDRVCNVGEPLTVKLFAELINNCNFNSVTIYSPHSEVTPALLNNCVIQDLDIKFVEEIINETKSGHIYNIVCPDAGAGKRVSKIVKQLTERFKWLKFELIRCEKIRDVATGELKGFFVQADSLNNYPTLIIDDINSMGGTFIGLKSKLKEKGAGETYLFTSHADCQKGLDNVSEYFTKVFTTNSKQDYKENEKIKVFKLEL